MAEVVRVHMNIFSDVESLITRVGGVRRRKAFVHVVEVLAISSEPVMTR